MTDRPTFKLHSYNPRRRARKVEAAHVLVTWPNGKEELLWMNERDIRANIKEFGPCEGLEAARNAYRLNLGINPAQ